MPRPGPRPYECVRRAWHSERHQPMRGLIIQQIFRLVHDNHSAATKKNKEWQEKLPIVVLKAEEIMYSKANSEAEYSNVETLWIRVNDAVDTIIRKDESTETGDLLPPCVEAALNLACVPVRASRSQRHNNPRTYLRPSHEEGSDMSSKLPNENYAHERNSDVTPLHASNRSMLKMGPSVDSPRLVWDNNQSIIPNTNHHIASSCERLPSIGINPNAPSNRGSVYPLYYGMGFKPQVSQLGFHAPQKSDNIIVGVPIFSSVAENAEAGCLQNLFPCGGDKNAAKETFAAASNNDDKGKGPHMGFDLSLRLGVFSDSNSSREKSSQDEEKQFSFFPMESAFKSRERENQSVDIVSRKRKQPFNAADIENDQLLWSQDSSSNKFADQTRRPSW
ncbi:hypothetical protein ABFS83_10G112700 [Erythranthe nasuta]